MLKKKRQEISIHQLKMLILKKDQKKYLNCYAKIIALEEEIEELNKETKIINGTGIFKFHDDIDHEI